jgi:hypothetical protein
LDNRNISEHKLVEDSMGEEDNNMGILEEDLSVTEVIPEDLRVDSEDLLSDSEVNRLEEDMMDIPEVDYTTFLFIIRNNNIRNIEICNIS